MTDPAKKQREDGKQKGDRASPSQMSRRRQPEPAGRDLSPRRNRNRSRSESRDRSASKWRKMERSPRRRYNRSPDRWRRDRSVSRGKDRSYSRSRSRSIDRRRSRSPGDSRDRSRSPAVRRRARSRSPLYRRRRYSRSLSREDFRVRGGVRGGYGRRNEPRPNRRRRSPSPFVKRSRGQRGYVLSEWLDQLYSEFIPNSTMNCGAMNDGNDFFCVDLSLWVFSNPCDILERGRVQMW